MPGSHGEPNHVAGSNARILVSSKLYLMLGTPFLMFGKPYWQAVFDVLVSFVPLIILLVREIVTWFLGS